MKLTAEEREIAIVLIEALSEYGLTEHLAQCGENCIEDWYISTGLYKMGFNLRYGATKTCISHRDLENWVIKVGHTEKVTLNYATLEYDNYCFAKEAGFDYYFPTTLFLGNFFGHPFYLQEEVECNEDLIISDWYDQLRGQYEEDGVEYDDDCLWDEVYGMDDYDKAFLTFGDEQFCDFLMEHSIGDLHEGNFGYTNGHMVIIDFSGWRG